MAIPHGDAGLSGIAQAVTQTQCGDDDQTQDWDTEVLSHALAHVLNKDKLDPITTDEFTAFMLGNGIDNACLF